MEKYNLPALHEKDFKGDSKAYFQYRKDLTKLNERIESGKIKDEKIQAEVAKFNAKQQRSIIKAEQKLVQKLEKERKAEEKRLAKYKRSEKYINEQIERKNISMDVYEDTNKCENNVLGLLIYNFNIQDAERFFIIMKTACPTLIAFKDITVTNLDLENENIKALYVSTLVRVLSFLKLKRDDFAKEFNLDVDEVESFLMNMTNKLIETK